MRIQAVALTRGHSRWRRLTAFLLYAATPSLASMKSAMMDRAPRGTRAPRLARRRISRWSSWHPHKRSIDIWERGGIQ
jgi:hypothetical protein